MARLVIKTAWTIATIGERQVPVENLAIVVEDGRIADLTRSPPADAETISLAQGIAVPGFINLHNHAINAPLFRGIVDDLPRSAIGESKVYSMLMPMGGLAATFLDEHELKAIMALGVLEVLRSGVTTLVDQFRPPQASIFDLARQWGLRLYGAPYLFSPAAGAADASVAGASRGSLEGETGLAEFERLFRTYDGGRDGLMRVILGPHAADSCAPDLLRRVDAIASERNILVTIHLAQSQGEVERVAQQRGLGCAAYIQSVGLLREGVILAHGTHLRDDELRLVRDAGATIANCASVFLRGGKAPNFERFRRAGVRVGIGTDAERMDFFAQLRATGFASKQAYGAGDAATAAELLRAATMGAADILRRPDLGRIEKGATADLLVIDALKPHLQPVNDPVRSVVWYATPADIDTVLINGRAVIRGGKAVGIDEAAIIAAGAAATRRVWAESRVRGYFPLEADPMKP
jgi:cytosine/adenosine deaminase-related metal-dependent hydrolase